MRINLRFSGLLLGLLLGIKLSAEVVNPVKWTWAIEDNGNQIYSLKFKATIDLKWHLYSQHIPEGGPIATSFKFAGSEAYELKGKVAELSKVESQYDPNFAMQIKMFSKEAVFVQKIKVKKAEAFEIKGTFEFMSCNDNTCLPPREEEFTFKIPATKLSDDKTSANQPKLEEPKVIDAQKDTLSAEGQSVSPTIKLSSANPIDNKPSETQSLWAFFILAFLAGIAGVLTPCVYPMIPMTVSFFMRGEQKRSKGILKGLIFGLSIILIYTSIGLIVSLTKSGADVTSLISTHWLPNLIFFILFLVFAASFLGLFELVLPGSISNKLDEQADKGGYLAAFFMALTLVVVSFSCTGPIVGAILVEASKGFAMKPLLGMFGFSLAFAIPFVVFAVSPSLMKGLAKSGSWLNSVKVVMGFILLAFSLKFLLAIDTVYHFNMLSREVYLSIWIVIFSLLGLYLIGKIKFSHDSELKYVGVPRLLFAIASFSFAVYLVPGLFGASLSSISSMLPPPSKHSVFQSSESTSSQSKLCGTPKYSDFLELPYGLEGYFDLKEGLACAKQQHKPILLDVKGHTCSNCKKMEAEVWSDPQVLAKLRNDFIIIALYTDEKYELPQSEWFTSSFDGKVKKTIGAQNLDFEINTFKANTQPLYAVLDTSGKPVVAPIGLSSKEDFLKMLETAKAKF